MTSSYHPGMTYDPMMARAKGSKGKGTSCSPPYPHLRSAMPSHMMMTTTMMNPFINSSKGKGYSSYHPCMTYDTMMAAKGKSKGKGKEQIYPVPLATMSAPAGKGSTPAAAASADMQQIVQTLTQLLEPLQRQAMQQQQQEQQHQENFAEWQPWHRGH